jgi:PPM family protein phosphatase
LRSLWFAGPKISGAKEICNRSFSIGFNTLSENNIKPPPPPIKVPPPPKPKGKVVYSGDLSTPILISSGETDIGQVRSVNQDVIYVDDENMLYIVADGMGGHAGGEVASRVCVDSIFEYLAKVGLVGKNRPDSLHDPDLTTIRVETLLHEAINWASSQIYEKALEDPMLRGMGTTATLAVFRNNLCHLAHVGDSRLYFFREGFLYQVSSDHSLVSEQIKAGLLNEDDAEVFQLRNVITRSVGYQEQEEVDTGTVEIFDKDKIMLCSDGLHGKVSDIAIAAAMPKKTEGLAAQLVNEANENGGDDNISVVTIEVKLSK